MSTLTLRSPLSNMLARLRPLGERRTRKYALLTFTVDAGLVFTLLVAVQSYLPEQYQASEAIAGYVLAAYGAAKLIGQLPAGHLIDRKSTRLNSSHTVISYAVFCLKKKNK